MGIETFGLFVVFLCNMDYLLINSHDKDKRQLFQLKLVTNNTVNRYIIIYNSKG